MPENPVPDPKLPPSLALAVIISANSPLILLDGDLAILAASASFCTAFGFDPKLVAGKTMFVLGNGEWDVPRFRSLLDATLKSDISIDAYEMDLNSGGQVPRKLVLNAQKLGYDDADHPRILLAIADVTEARANERLKDDLLREKAVLLQEIQHRVANSLQIIASVLMMSARKVQSEETRFHLQDAHSRVMSIAAVQRQLSVSNASQVKLRAYFTQLCASLGASMIRDPRQTVLQVTADDSEVDPDTSVSLGLIVTELVINALKHAFPADRIGKIVVDYRAEQSGWTLSVTDNGVGMSAKPGSVEPGLGTSIVEALASKLRARVVLGDAKPGVTVSIIHPQVANANVEAPAQAV